MNKLITISEYGCIGCDKVSYVDSKFTSHRDLEVEEFKELKEYWESSKETFKLFEPENPNCLKATNYVGIIQTKSLTIEILPKVYDGIEDNKIKYRNILISMLRPLLNINEIFINEATLDSRKDMNIYELFISLFVDEMDNLIHKGLKSEYIIQENNQSFLKGKLKIREQIQFNYIHKERFYVEYDEYLPDRVENRLLKSTINFLLKHTNDSENKKALRQQLFIFDDVDYSSNYTIDIAKVNLHRGMEHYIVALKFAKVFLLNESFTSILGSDNVFSMLFPMEKVFENYIEYLLENSKKENNIKKVNVNGLKNDKLLEYQSDNSLLKPCGIINQQPDYLLEINDENLPEDGKKFIVTDAKWKILDIDEKNDNCVKVSLNAGDVYQVFSYLNYYDAHNTAYIFAPKTKDFYKSHIFKYINKIESHIKVEEQKIVIYPIDLEDCINSHKLDFLLSNL